MNNPFTLSFGKKPLQYVSRISQTNAITENFSAEIPSNQLYLITGVRGSGKTVMMANIANEMRKREDWIVVELNATRDLLQSLAAKLYSLPEMNAHFVQAKYESSVESVRQKGHKIPLPMKRGFSYRIRYGKIYYSNPF